MGGSLFFGEMVKIESLLPLIVEGAVSADIVRGCATVGCAFIWWVSLVCSPDTLRGDI